MSRTKGSFGIAASIEPKAAAPLDARTIVKNKEELTTSGSFPYPYVGMEVFVLSEMKKYRLIGSDPNVLSNWEELEGDTGGGHIIEDNEGTELEQRDTLQFSGDIDASDDDTNEKTIITPHELTNAEMAEIVTPLPGATVDMPILFDESGAEYQVGWYKFANGTKKPVYQKTIVDTMPTVATDGTSVEKYVYIGSSVDVVVNANVSVRYVNAFINLNITNNVDFTNKKITDARFFVFYENAQTSTNKNKLCISSRYTSYNNCNFYAIIQYTKTTDTPS